MNKIKICHLTSVHPSNDNRIFFKECLTLSQNGYDVTLIAPHGKNEIVEGVQIVHIEKLPGRLKRMFITSFFYMLVLALKNSASIYHFHDPELMPLGLVLRLFGKTVIYDVHENLSASILSKPYLGKNAKKLVSKLIGGVESFCSYFFSGIVAARPDIAAIFNNKNIIVLRNFPVLDFLPPELDKNSFQKEKLAVIYVGGMTKIRGIFELVEAFSNLNQAELWLLGPIKEQQLKSDCENSLGWKNVRYFGSVTAKEVFNYIQKADIGIITFLPEPNHITTLATKPFEYMACGLPMIMSNFPYWKDTFSEVSVFVDPTKPAEIAIAINELCSNPELMKRLGQRGKELSLKEFNWEAENGRLLDLYQQILNPENQKKDSE